MKKIILFFVLAVSISSIALANHYADFYVLPVASHVRGANATLWMSDIAIQNVQSFPLAVSLVLIESGEASVDNVIALNLPGAGTTIPAGGSVLLRDVLANQGKAELAGAILVGAEAPFAITSRSYVTAPGGGTFGQTVPPARDFLENTLGDTDPATATAYLPGLVNNARFRTNIGFVAGTSNLATSALQIQVTLKDAAGATLGSQTFTIDPGAFRHLQFSSRAIADQTFDVGSAELRILSGDGAVVPYASVVDNTTADAIFVSGQFPANAPFNKLALPTVFRQLFRQFAID